MNAADFQAWSDAVLNRVESALSDWVPAAAPAGLGEAMRYGVLDGGKRLRALLVQAAAEATGKSAAPLDPVAAGKAAASACAGCHGETGVSSMPGLPSRFLIPRIICPACVRHCAINWPRCIRAHAACA